MSKINILVEMKIFNVLMKENLYLLAQRFGEYVAQQGILYISDQGGSRRGGRGGSCPPNILEGKL